ncbi:MAG: hypothetical protein RLZZ468_235 [Cyanobacteriota bacterium]
MVAEVTRQELPGWGVPAMAKPDPATGRYQLTRGGSARAAQRMIEVAYPTERPLPPRLNRIRGACAAHARRVAGHGPGWDAGKAEGWLAEERAVAEALVKHPFWSRLEVLAAPVHVADPVAPIGATADLLVRFVDGGDLGVAVIQTNPRELLLPDAVAAELGAVLLALSDSCGELVSRAFVIWAVPGRQIELMMVDADAATIAWVDAMGLCRWREGWPASGEGMLEALG